MIQDGSQLTDQPKMQGSLMIYEAATIDDVWDAIKEDVYYTGRVVSAFSSDVAIVLMDSSVG